MTQPGIHYCQPGSEEVLRETKLESHRGHSNTAAVHPELDIYKNDPMKLIMDTVDIRRYRQELRPRA